MEEHIFIGQIRKTICQDYKKHWGKFEKEIF
jgi:hypothetical protein